MARAKKNSAISALARVSANRPETTESGLLTQRKKAPRMNAGTIPRATASATAATRRRA